MDFIGLEALRVFYPKVFDAIRNNKDIVAGHIDEFTREKGSGVFNTKVNEMFKSTISLLSCFQSSNMPTPRPCTATVQKLSGRSRSASALLVTSIFIFSSSSRRVRFLSPTSRKRWNAPVTRMS